MPELVNVPGGTLVMGSDEFYAEEGPVHERVIRPFAIDATPVTNAEFAAFVKETGYMTVAERPLDPALFSGADPDDLVPGALVFTPTSGPVDLGDWRQWWRYVPQACWKHPFGPPSSWTDRADHPVVQIAYEDALAYATWAGKRLPDEPEWEWAARGGIIGARYAWGNAKTVDGRLMANTWQGAFPYRNDGACGWIGTAPVGSFPPNGYGLWDTIGNVWEWTSDLWTPRHFPPETSALDSGGRASLLERAAAESASAPVRRVLKGGSHLCAPEYCLRYRPAARTSQTEDSATTHIGFRCAL